MNKDNLGNRMKSNYEDKSRYKLIRRMPVIIRLDGKSFHTFTKYCEKPFDNDLSDAMTNTMLYLLHHIQGAKLGYQQSDEISILVTDYDDLQTDAWFDNNIQKISSISSSMATAYFNHFYTKTEKFAFFDSRCFNIPKEEVNNYFIWRQKDWERNSLQMVCRSYFSHKELHGKKRDDMHNMLYSIGINWADLDDKWKNGCTIYKNESGVLDEDNSIIFVKDRFCERYV